MIPEALQASQDSLLQIIQTQQDTHAVNAYFELGRQHLANKEYDAAISYFDKGDSLASEIGFELGRLRLIRAKSVFYGRTGAVEKGHELNRLGLAMIDEVGAPPVYKVDYLINQGALYYWEDKIGQAIEPYLEAVALAREHQLEDKRSMLLNNLGIFYRNLERYREALDIYEESLEIRRSNRDTAGIANTLFNMAAAYGKIDSLELAYQVIEESENLYRILGDESEVRLCQQSKGSFLISMKRIDEAYEYLAPLAEIEDLGFDVWQACQLHLYLAQIHEARDEFSKLGQELDQVEEVILQTSFTEPLMEFHRLRYLQYKNENSPALALDHLEKYQQYFEELNNEQEVRFQEEMETKYLTVEKDYQIAQQNIQLLQTEKRRNQLLFSLLGLIVIAGVIIFNIRKRHNFRYQLTLRDNALKNEQIERLEQEKKIVALDYMLAGEEKERRRIAKDLHDSLGSLLTSAKAQLKNTLDNVEALKDRLVLQKAEDIVGEAAQEVRRISHDMMPDALVNLGLTEAITDLANQVGKSSDLQIITHYFDVEAVRLSDPQKLNIYRIIQELLQNVVKHAHASQVVIQFSLEENRMNLLVEDDGIGFEVERMRNAGGVGLKNIRSRVQYLEGQLNIQSKAGGPTVFDIHFPI